VVVYEVWHICVYTKFHQGIGDEGKNYGDKLDKGKFDNSGDNNYKDSKLQIVVNKLLGLLL